MNVCCGLIISEHCILQTVKTYLTNNPILCTGCSAKIPHECMYVWNTGTVIGKHLLNHLSSPAVFGEYYEIYKRNGHEHISENKLFEKCNVLLRDIVFIAQLIPHVIQEQSSSSKLCLVEPNHYIIDLQGFQYFSDSKHSEFVIREFCLVSINGTVLFHCLVKLPCHMHELSVGIQKQNQWLTKMFHGLEWDSTNGYTVSVTYP